MSHDIFLSYRRTDRELAAQLVRELEKRGLSVWYDADIEAGQDWREETAAALQASGMLVILFSESANDSRQLAKELAVADELDKPVVPILIEDCRPKGAYLNELADRNWIEAWPEPHSRMPDLVELLTALAGKAPAPAPSEPPLVANDEMPREAQTDSPAPGMANAYIGRKRGAAAGGPAIWVVIGVVVLVVGVVVALVSGGAVVAFVAASVVAVVAALAARAMFAGKSALARFQANLRRL